MQILLFIFGILMFAGLVLAHEFGHFVIARRNNVDVEEFGLGFPPRAMSRRTKSGMLLSLNWLPLGGFVKLKGEHDADKTKGSFGAANLGAKSRILLAGVTANAIVGLLLLTVLALIGMPKLIDKNLDGQDQFTVASDTKISRQDVLVGYISAGSPAQKAGLQSRDIIEYLTDGQTIRRVSSPEQLKAATEAYGGRTVQVALERNGQTEIKSITLRPKSEVEASLKTDNPKGYLGVAPNLLEIRRSTWSAPIVAVGFTGQLAELTFKGLGHAFAGLGSIIAGSITGNKAARQNGQTSASSQVGGPVAIVAVLWGAGTLGFVFILTIIAIISLTLAMINVLPLPALDGGRLFVALTSRVVLKRPLSPRTEEMVHGIGMAVLLALVALVTIVDVHRFF
jgi:regulator of sigma E protease